MTELETWTIGRLLEWTKDYLAKHGSDTARLDAEVLLAHARSCQRIELYTAFDEVASEALRGEFRDLVRQRATGKPVAYLVGHREFYSLTFHVNTNVLIPRPETEFLVIRLLDLARQHFPSGTMELVDVGTGSGILAICAALYLRHGTKTWATDVSDAALDVARRNAAAHDVESQVEFVQGDLLGSIGPDQRFDFVVSNPPYVSEAEFDELDPQVKEHEPRLALVGGANGTELIERLLHQTRTFLKPGGWIVMEVSPMICDHVKAHMQAMGCFENLLVTEDLAKLPRIIEAQRISKDA